MRRPGLQLASGPLGLRCVYYIKIKHTTLNVVCSYLRVCFGVDGICVECGEQADVHLDRNILLDRDGLPIRNMMFSIKYISKRLYHLFEDSAATIALTSMTAVEASLEIWECGVSAETAATTKPNS